MAQRPSPAANRALAVLRAVGYWAPVWLPLVLLWQVAALGWRPTRLERERLERERGVVVERHERTRERYERMRAEAQAWGDPVYRARLREILRKRREEQAEGSENEQRGR